MPHGVEAWLIRAGCTGCGECPALRPCLKRGCLVLHALPPEDGAALLHLWARDSVCFLLADYALPERNLHLPVFWLRHSLALLSGHAAAYRGFMRAGGLEGAVARAGLRVLERRIYGCGLMTVLRCAGRPPARH